MKGGRVIYLLLISLALNLGTAVSVAYRRHRAVGHGGPRQRVGPLSLAKVNRALSLGPEQPQQVASLVPAHRCRVREMRTELAYKRQELFDLIKESNPPWTSVQAKIGELSWLQGDLEFETVRFWLEVQKHFTQEQRPVFQEMLNYQMLAVEGRHGGECPVSSPRQPVSKLV